MCIRDRRSNERLCGNMDTDVNRLTLSPIAGNDRFPVRGPRRSRPERYADATPGPVPTFRRSRAHDPN
eukprot:13969367-Alexandrium_andersonii.AAC.1